MQRKRVSEYLEPLPNREERPEHPSKALWFRTMGEVRQAARSGPDNHFSQENVDCWDIKFHGVFQGGYWIESTLELDDEDQGERKFYVNWLWKSRAGSIHLGTSIPLATLPEAVDALAVIEGSRR